MNNEKVLSEGWEWTTLGDVVTPTRISVQSNNLSSLPYIGMEHIESETMKLVGIGSASELKSNTMHFLSGDVLYGRMRPYLNKVFRPDFEGLCSPELLVFRESPNLSSQYLQYFLNSWHFKSFASHLVEGDRPRVDWGQLQAFSFPLPPLNEQHRIVSIIEEQFTRLDAAIASLHQDKARLKQARASVLKAAVEGTLTEAWRTAQPDIEPAEQLLERILTERRERWEADQLAKMQAKGIIPKDDRWKENYIEPIEPDVEQLSELPEGWDYTFLMPLLSTIRKGVMTGPFGSLLKKYEHLPLGVPVLGIENISSMRFIDGSKIHISEQKAAQLLLYDAQPGDVLISRSGTVGEVCVVPDHLGEARISTNLMRISLATKGMLPQFLCLLFNGSPFVLGQVSDLCKGSTRDFLNQEILLSLIFPLPPLAEQQQIVAEVEARLSVITQAESAVETSLKRAERTRQSILQKAFSGQLAPQDSNDEPASVLLERIRAEREKHELAEQQRKKEERMNRPHVIRKTSSGKERKPLVEVLHEEQRPLTPTDLFKKAELEEDEVEDVQSFHVELLDEVFVHETIKLVPIRNVEPTEPKEEPREMLEVIDQ